LRNDEFAEVCAVAAIEAQICIRSHLFRRNCWTPRPQLPRPAKCDPSSRSGVISIEDDYRNA
jgi:hypothetical protein